MRRLLLLLIITLGDWPCQAQTVDVKIERSHLLSNKASEMKPKNPDATNVVTDTNWLVSDSLVQGWTATSFDDTKWKNVIRVPGPDENGEHYTLANQMGQPTAATWIWSATSESCYLRKSFDAPKEIRRAEMLLIADDNCDVYVNSEKIGMFSSLHLGWGHRGCAKLLDLAPYLIPGQQNVIACSLVNNGSCKGFAADVRINDDPFVPSLVRKAIPDPPAELVARVKELFADCDNPSFRKREAATRQLRELVEKHGQMLYSLLKELRDRGSLEQEWRIGSVWAVLKKERNAALLTTGEDGRFYYPRPGLEYIKLLMQRGPNGNVSSYRHLMQLKLEREEDKTRFDGAFRKNWSTIVQHQRGDFILALSFLDWGDFADLLDGERQTTLDPLIASAYGRMETVELTKDRLDWLKKAKTSKHEPTARAATVALLARGVK